jgi:hypothetical protein
MEGEQVRYSPPDPRGFLESCGGESPGIGHVRHWSRLSRGISSGFWKDLDELSSLSKGYARFTPNMDPRKRSEKIALWRKALKAALSVH